MKMYYSPGFDNIDPSIEVNISDKWSYDFEYQDRLGSFVCDIANGDFDKIVGGVYAGSLRLETAVETSNLVKEYISKIKDINLEEILSLVFLDPSEFSNLTLIQRFFAYNFTHRSMNYKPTALLDFDYRVSNKDFPKDDYKKLCHHISQINFKVGLCYYYTFNSFRDLILFYLNEMVKSNVLVKQCKNCNKYFIPSNRSDTFYCDNVSPQDASKTCKEYGAIQTYKEKLRNDTAAGLYRAIYMQKQMLLRRNPDIQNYKTDFENYKIQSKKWKQDVKNGIKSEDDYVNWLESIKSSKS